MRRLSISVESLEVKAPVGPPPSVQEESLVQRGGEGGSDPYREASNLAGRSKCVNQEATKVIARAKRIAGALGVPSRSTLGEGHVDIAALELSMIGLPGVVEDGMLGANEQRKPGTARGSPRGGAPGMDGTRGDCSRLTRSRGRTSIKLRVGDGCVSSN
jgi:hypothetical protein